MADKPKKKKGSSKPPAAADDENERPTLNPPFDVEAFARATAASNPRSHDVSTTRPPPRPPALPEPRGEQTTLTNEAELEAARAKSARNTEPPRRRSSALSMADARSASQKPAAARASEGRVPSPPSNSSEGRIPSPPSSIEAAVLRAVSTPPPEITERTIDDPISEMRERFSLGDYTGALEIAELILTEDSSNLEAAECGESCRSVLENMYAARLGSVDLVPMVIVPRTQMQWLSIDHRAGFVLSLIDGSSTLETVVDMSG
ncbi:MAG TPA: hypothetical protein VGY54_06800, partial [Polyangiaceae bacterium]|nr:hypothetical protein [Polyangiaceae bacterium]